MTIPEGPSLFDSAAEDGGFDDTTRPLADRLRPRSLDEVVGQDHLLSADAPLGRMVHAGRISSIILWGPPGCGKTTIARLLAGKTGLVFEQVSATFSGVADLRRVFAAASKRRQIGQGTLLFVDEIHRFNRAQQDSFLPYVEDGTVVLVGATTENPSFELVGALLSRCHVMVLHRLDGAALAELMDRAEGLAHLVASRAPLYDKSSDEHYNLISALHKSMRGSDPDASLYWLSRMLLGGEDPLYVARRLIRFACEDVGMADPNALSVALSAWESYERLGSPEGEIAIAQAVVYLASAPKSISVYRGFNRAWKLAKETGSLMPPAHILNAPTRLMKDLGYGAGYQYDPDLEDGFSGADYFPDGVARRRLYEPTDNGYEHAVRDGLAQWERMRRLKERDS
ncbi:replication-associated recombination protein A [Schaalia cardiffensis]|uniref:replication-associated recombination protein A n=1 Tax=Schaalia cardiffensis TaxID=181487 RepID=UPI0023F119F2|nr:replication-associated recombination protein A [Schaalia cardiffensis]